MFFNDPEYLQLFSGMLLFAIALRWLRGHVQERWQELVKWIKERFSNG